MPAVRGCQIADMPVNQQREGFIDSVAHPVERKGERRILYHDLLDAFFECSAAGIYNHRHLLCSCQVLTDRCTGQTAAASQAQLLMVEAGYIECADQCPRFKQT